MHDHKDIKSIEAKRSKEEDRNKDNNEQNEDKTIDHDNVDERANDRDEDEIVIDGNENEIFIKVMEMLMKAASSGADKMHDEEEGKNIKD